MDNYLMNSLFAGNLLQFFFQKQNVPWESPHVSISHAGMSQFDKEIGIAVFTIWKENYAEMLACYKELCTKGVHDKEAFGKCAVSAADMYFSEGYSSGSFLGYCAIVLGVATIYYSYPLNGIPEIAAEVVALVLLAHQLTGQFEKHGGWDGLRETSKQFNNLQISERQKKN